MDNDYVIGNWPTTASTKTIPIRSSKIGDWLADDFRAILLAILEPNEERRLYVGKRPEGMCLSEVLVLRALIYIFTQVRSGSLKDLMEIASFVPSISRNTVRYPNRSRPP